MRRVGGRDYLTPGEGDKRRRAGDVGGPRYCEKKFSDTPETLDVVE
jgi:hypothetical protein